MPHTARHLKLQENQEFHSLAPRMGLSGFGLPGPSGLSALPGESQLQGPRSAGIGFSRPVTLCGLQRRRQTSAYFGILRLLAVPSAKARHEYPKLKKRSGCSLAHWTFGKLTGTRLTRQSPPLPPVLEREWPQALISLLCPLCLNVSEWAAVIGRVALCHRHPQPRPPRLVMETRGEKAEANVETKAGNQRQRATGCGLHPLAATSSCRS